MSFTCPKCWRTSYHPTDEVEGYCGNCHEFTGRHDGDQRHSSSSTPAGQERKMRMPTNDEDGKAQPEMPEMQREGNCPGLQQLRWERMEPNHEQDVRAMQRTRVSRASGDPIAMPPQWWMNYPGQYRFYWGAVALGMAVGITWTAFMLSPVILRHITRDAALSILYGIAMLQFVGQGWMLYRWDKALKIRRKEWDVIHKEFKRQMDADNEELKRAAAERLQQWEDFKKNVERDNAD